MKEPEQAFTAALRRNLEAAWRDCGVAQKRLEADLERYGGVRCARELLRRGRCSDGFEELARAGRLDLSLEALVISGAYGALFTDEEVNRCFAALCGAGCDAWGRFR